MGEIVPGNTITEVLVAGEILLKMLKKRNLLKSKMFTIVTSKNLLKTPAAENRQQEKTGLINNMFTRLPAADQKECQEITSHELAKMLSLLSSK